MALCFFFLFIITLCAPDINFQVVLEQKLTLFIDDPLKVSGLEKNEDWVKFGYGYYVGAPWVVGQLKGNTYDNKVGIMSRSLPLASTLGPSHCCVRIPWYLLLACSQLDQIIERLPYNMSQ